MILARILAAAVLLSVVSLGLFVAVSPWSGVDAAGADEGFDRFLQTGRELGYSTSRITSTPLLLRHDNAIDPADTLLVVSGAERPPRAEEADFLRTFLEEGGRVLVAEEGGHAGLLTSPFGVTFERAPVVHGEGPTPISYQIATAQYVLEATTPTPLIVEGDADVLAWTPESAFADRDGDGEFGLADPLGPFPMAAEVAVGDRGGRLVVLGSLDLLSDGRADSDGAAEWRRDLLADLLAPGGSLVLDESHQPHESGLVRTMAGVVRMTSESPVRWLVLGTMLLAATALAVLGGWRFVPWSKHRHEPGRYRRRADLLAPGQVTTPGAESPDARTPPTVRWTRASAMLAAFGALCLGIGVLIRNAEAVAAGVASWGLLVGSLVARAPRLEVMRAISPEKTSEGRPVRVEVQVTASRPASVELRDLLPVEDRLLEGTNHRSGLLHRSQAHVLSYQVAPQTRGPHRVGPLRARSSDPFGLRVHETPIAESGTVFASPRREPMNGVRLPVRRPQILLGPHTVNRAGEGTEFHAIRDYQTGDPMRTVNWRASARSKDLMVTQRVLDSQTEIALVLDARAIAEAGRADRSPLTLGARAAATLADAALKARDRVRLVAYGPQTKELPPAPRATFLPALEDLLGRLPAGGDQSFEEVARELLPSLRKGMPVVLLSALEGDETFAPGARLLAGHGLPLVVVAYPLSIEEEGAEDAESIEEKRRATVRGIRGTGATVYEVRPGTPLEDVFRFGGAA